MFQSPFGRLGRASEAVVQMDPGKFYATVDLMRGEAAGSLGALRDVAAELDEACAEADAEVEELARVSHEVDVEDKRLTRFKNPFKDSGAENPMDDLRQAAGGGQSFIHVLFDVATAMQLGYRTMRDACRGATPEPLLVSPGRGRERLDAWTSDFESLQRMMAEISMNEGAISRFISGVFMAEAAEEAVVHLGRVVTDRLDGYHRMLLRRHSVEGVKVHGDPVATDIALAVFENVDADGEIQDGKSPDEISAYSGHKAEIICRAVKEGKVSEFVRDSAKLIAFAKENLIALQALAETLAGAARPAAEALRRIYGPAFKKPKTMSKAEFHAALVLLDVLDPRSIKFKEKTGMLSAEERFALNFRNETLSEVSKRLKDERASSKTLIAYVLRRKAELRDYYRDENSFYVCKVGSGNPFLGTAPGELEIVPGARPIVDMAEIAGSGFDEVREFFKQVESSGKWHDVFLSTSPSRTADKSNVLLVGPMGCGKSEVLRAVGGDRRSIGIFATGSDFLTCWKGEAEKNPKRLFEAAHKLQRESKKHVHILIDEIDTILNDDHGPGSFGSTSLVTEFQNLMDGVVHYPSISIWGCTNRVDRIPMPMIRRFSKVLIVGELSQKDREDLLRRFSAFLPCDVPEKAWADLARRLKGATGDVVRKIVDHVWRDKMSGFVERKPEDAAKVKDYLETCQGQRFTLADFTGEQRKKLHEMIRPHASVTAGDLEASVEAHLKTVAVRSEIETAVETYARARAFLSQLDSRSAKEA